MAQVSCPQCGTEYKIKIPMGGLFILALDARDKMIHPHVPHHHRGPEGQSFLLDLRHLRCHLSDASHRSQSRSHDHGAG